MTSKTCLLCLHAEAMATLPNIHMPILLIPIANKMFAVIAIKYKLLSFKISSISIVAGRPLIPPQ